MPDELTQKLLEIMVPPWLAPRSKIEDVLYFGLRSSKANGPGNA